MGQIRKRGKYYQIRYYRNGQRIEVQKTLHPVWREKKDIEANLESRESF